MTVHKNDRLVELIYDAASDSRRWLYVLKELKQNLNADAVNWSEFDVERRKGRILDSIGYSQSYLSSYAETYAALNVWLQELWSMVPGRVSLGEEILTEAQLTKTKFYVEWLEPQGLIYRICLIVKQKDQRIFYLEALRSKAKYPYDKHAKLYLSSLLPHLQQALQRNDYLWQLAVFKDIFDRWSCALLVVDKHARPLMMNCAAEQLLHDKSIFDINFNRLTPTGLKAASRFKDMVVKAASYTSTGDANQTNEAMVVPRRNHRIPVWIIVTPLSRKLRVVVCQEVEVALVYVYLPENVRTLQESMLKTLFGFTPAEQRLVLLILEGWRLHEAAASLGISINTARTHMKRIYVKTKTQCQADLVRVLLSGGWESLSYVPDQPKKVTQKISRIT